MSEPKQGDSKKISISGIEDALRDAEQSVERIRTDSRDDLPTMTQEQAEALAESGGLDEAVAFDDDPGPADDEDGEIFDLDDEPEAGGAATEQAKQLVERLIRMAADFDNYKKRVARDQERIQARAAETLAKALLPVMDNLERALQHAEADPASLAEGIQMVHRQFAEVFTGGGIQGFGEAGDTFDPTVHEAMAQRPSETHPPGAIDEVYQKGYTLNGQLIRPALVIVAGPADGQQAAAATSAQPDADSDTAPDTADGAMDEATAEEDGESNAD